MVCIYKTGLSYRSYYTYEKCRYLELSIVDSDNALELHFVLQLKDDDRSPFPSVSADMTFFFLNSSMKYNVRNIMSVTLTNRTDSSNYYVLACIHGNRRFNR